VRPARNFLCTAPVSTNVSFFEAAPPESRLGCRILSPGFCVLSSAYLFRDARRLGYAPLRPRSASPLIRLSLWCCPLRARPPSLCLFPPLMALSPVSTSLPSGIFLDIGLRFSAAPLSTILPQSAKHCGGDSFPRSSQSQDNPHLSPSVFDFSEGHLNRLLYGFFFGFSSPSHFCAFFFFEL